MLRSAEPFVPFFKLNKTFTNRDINEYNYVKPLSPLRLDLVLVVHVPHLDRLVGLVVRSPPRERKTPGSNPACAGNFSGSSHTSDSKIGTPVATLPGAWRYRVSTGTGRPGVSIL